MDVAAWSAAGLVDLVSAGPYAADTQVPVEAWKDCLAPGTPRPSPSIPSIPSIAVHPTDRQPRTA